MGRTWADLVFTGDADSAALSRAVERGTLLRLGTGVYSGLVDRAAEDVVTEHVWRILDRKLPDAVIVDRSAVMAGPIGGVLSVQHSRARPFVLPGLVVHVRPGPGPQPGDMPFLGTSLHLSSIARQLLDNLRPTASHPSRTLTTLEVEAWIDALIRDRGEEGINRLRDQARLLAPVLGRLREMKQLDRLVSAGLATGDHTATGSTALAARAAGQPVDPARLERFSSLARYLSESAPDVVLDQPQDRGHRQLLPFYEAYFSNFIEGTEFTLDEAADIVFGERLPQDRPADAHDVLGTYEIVNDPDQMLRTPGNADELEALLLERHARVLGMRPDKLPGRYKVKANRAGASEFVAPELVKGTLREGFELGAGLIGPFERAVYLMFLVSEVHPFADGNGRIARIMMNAELVAAGEVRLIVPIVYRENYLDGLRAATRTGHFAALVKVLSFARRYTAQVDFATRVSAENDLRRTHALRDPREAEAAGVRLVLPSSLPHDDVRRPR